MPTGVSDLVLVNVDGKPGFYARVEAIVPDVKPGWWQVKLLVLSFPLQVYTWILEETQINGLPFTMGGTPIKLEKVVSPAEPAEPVPNATTGEKPGGGKVVSLFERKKGE